MLLSCLVTFVAINRGVAIDNQRSRGVDINNIVENSENVLCHE